MEFDSKKLDKKIAGNEILAREFFLNLRSAHALEEMESALLSLNESKYVKFFFREKNLCIDSNVLIDNRLNLARDGSMGLLTEVIEAEFGLLSHSRGLFNLRLNDVKNSARIYQGETLVIETNKADAQITLEKGYYFLELDKKWYVLDLLLEKE